MSKHINKVLMMVAVLLSLSVFETYSQVTTGSMSGLVIDKKSGNALIGATVTAIHEPSGTQYGAIMKSNGSYIIPNMRVGGPYKIKASFVGYRAVLQDVSQLQLGQNLKVNFALEEEGVKTDAINVIADKNAILSGNRKGAEENISNQVINNFPTISRSFADFAKFMPQATPSTVGGGDGGNSIGMKNNKYNNIQIDGTQYNDLFGLGASGSPGGQASTNPISLDAIEEFQILLAPFDVRQGRFTGGGINAITRSGTNKTEGSVYFFGRNESMVGDLTSYRYLTNDANGSPLSIGNFRDSIINTPFESFNEFQTGFRLGGAIIENELFFFVNGEVTNRVSPIDNIGLIQGTNVEVRRAIADTVRNILVDNYGYDPGVLDGNETTRPSTKLFARLDWNIDRNNKLTFRHNFVDASSVVFGPSNQNILFGNRAYQFNSMQNSTVLQLSSIIGDYGSNELIIGYTSINDSRDFVGDPFPTIQVQDSRLGSGVSIFAGSENFSVANALKTNVFEFTNNFQLFLDDHTLTFGTQNEFFSFSNLFIRDNFGTYAFNNLENFRNGRADRLQYSFTNPGFDPKFAAEFNAVQLGFYAQDDWSVNEDLKISFGVRVDAPLFPDSPSYNPLADTTRLNADQTRTLGIRTDQVPDTRLLFSPRIGFNYALDEERKTQIRGGIGVFTGRVPFVWISNQYGNTGVEFARLDVRPGNVAILPDGTRDTLKVLEFKDANGTTEYQDPSRIAKVTEINYTTSDFSMPQVMRANLAFDHDLGFGFIGTLEGLYTQNLNEIYYRNLILTDGAAQTQFGTNLPGGRKVFGTYSAGTRNTNPTFSVGSPGGPFNNIIELSNTDQGYSWSLSYQLRKQFEDGLFIQAAYTYGESYDINSGQSSQALSQWRFNPVQDNPNEVTLGRSIFDIPHRLILSASKRFEYGDIFATTVSIFYEGRSGEPFSYVYDGDINADGQVSNDLLYVPTGRDDILFGSWGGSGSSATFRPASASMYDAWESYVERDDYLKENRGKVLERNGARSPWVHRFDLRIAQEIITDLTGNKDRFELTFDIINLGNMLNSEWGLVRNVANNSDPVLRYEGFISTPEQATAAGKPVGTPIFSFNNKKDPYRVLQLASQWQLQIGVRYTF